MEATQLGMLRHVLPGQTRFEQLALHGVVQDRRFSAVPAAFHLVRKDRGEHRSDEPHLFMIAVLAWIIDTSGIGVEFTTEIGYPGNVYRLDVLVTVILSCGMEGSRHSSEVINGIVVGLVERRKRL